MRNFTLKEYHLLLKELIKKGFVFVTFREFMSHNILAATRDPRSTSSIKLGQIEEFKKLFIEQNRICILRHDVDRSPENSLQTAIIEHELKITGSYYFRILPQSFDESIIQKIFSLGHEIGYHYEDVDLVLKSQKFNIKNKNGMINKEILIDLAYESFCKNLEIFRKNLGIKTICMHGSPLSKYDNKMIWEKYNYKDLGIKGEPYFDIDWSKFGYLTDTGRKWDGSDSSVRDKVESKFKFKFTSTQDIIKNIEQLPDKIMITVHPQRWNDNMLPWLNEYFSQNIKNIIKKYFYVKN